MVRLRFSSQGAGTPASTARRGGKESHRVENAPKREKRGGRVVVLCNRRRWSWEPFDPLSLFFCFSLLKKKRRPPRRRAAAESALDSLLLRSRRENSDPAARRGRGATQQEEPGAGRRPGRWSRLQGQKAISMPPLSLLAGALFSFLCFVPSSKEKKEARELSLHLARRRPSKRRRRGFSRGPGGRVRSRAIVRTTRSTNSEGHGYEAGRGRMGKEEGDSRCDERTKTTKGEKKTHFLCFSRCPCFPS